MDVSLVDRCVRELKGGKVAGLDEVCSENLLFSHPIIVCILVAVFNWVLETAHIPDSFSQSYTIPIPKISDKVSRNLTCGDFR